MPMTACVSVHNSKTVVLPKNRYMPSGAYTKPELKAMVRIFNQLENRNAARFILDMMVE
ncbi:MAG: hypothetical protein PHC62_08685 [Candidatus Izemoplasmatales bacterium]|nr:hypothetical protein [Candidatus Izemoplasmatales bacterium]